MSRTQRFGLLGAAVIVLLVAFLALRPENAVLLEADKVERLRVANGERVRFRVRSLSAEELHVHGYDIARELPPGKTVPVAFDAALAGVFEIELERAGEQIGSLRVDP